MRPTHFPALEPGAKAFRRIVDDFVRPPERERIVSVAAAPIGFTVGHIHGVRKARWCRYVGRYSVEARPVGRQRAAPSATVKADCAPLLTV